MLPSGRPVPSGSAPPGPAAAAPSAAAHSVSPSLQSGHSPRHAPQWICPGAPARVVRVRM